MISADKQVLLDGFLRRLPGISSSRLAKAVEVDRLIGGTGLPHDDILSALRPQLRAMPAVSRTPTPLRLFCGPFEDLLCGGPERTTKRKGRIARSSIIPVWNWLSRDLMPQRLHELEDAIRTTILQDCEGGLASDCGNLWTESSAVLKRVLAGPEQMAAAAKRLGGTIVAEDALEMAVLLGGAPDIEKLRRRLPKPVIYFVDEDVEFLRPIYDNLVERDPDLAPYVPLIVMARLEHRWEALRIAAILTGKSDDTIISNTDFGAVGELLFADLDDYVERIQAAKPQAFNPESLLADLAGFSELSLGVVKELGIRRDGKWGQRLAANRGMVAQALESLLERAPKEIFAALPQPKIGAFGKSSGPLDFSRGPEPKCVAKALCYAELLAHSRPFAAAASFSAKLTEVTEETALALRSFSEEILGELKAATPEARPPIDAHLDEMLKLCVLVLGSDETSLLRRRARLLGHR